MKAKLLVISVLVAGMLPTFGHPPSVYATSHAWPWPGHIFNIETRTYYDMAPRNQLSGKLNPSYLINSIIYFPDGTLYNMSSDSWDCFSDGLCADTTSDGSVIYMFGTQVTRYFAVYDPATGITTELESFPNGGISTGVKTYGTNEILVLAGRLLYRYDINSNDWALLSSDGPVEDTGDLSAVFLDNCCYFYEAGSFFHYDLNTSLWSTDTPPAGAGGKIFLREGSIFCVTEEIGVYAYNELSGTWSADISYPADISESWDIIFDGSHAAVLDYGPDAGEYYVINLETSSVFSQSTQVGTDENILDNNTALMHSGNIYFIFDVVIIPLLPRDDDKKFYVSKGCSG